MKKIAISLVCSVFFFYCNSCGVTKSNNHLPDIGDDTIKIAIADFLKVKALNKNAKIFSIRKKDYKSDKDKLVVIIGEGPKKVLFSKQAVVGSKGRLPSRHLVIDNKLFYWWDDNYPLTEEAIAAFKKFNLLQDDMDGVLVVAENEINESQKFAFYYFCKKNIKNYKRVISRKIIDVHSTAEIECK